MKRILVDGRLGRDAELKTAANGKKYVAFSLANNTHVKSEDKTTWYNVVCFDSNTVENRLDYLKKGKLIFVSGVYDTKAYVGKDGSLRVDESIFADRIDFIQVGGNNQQNQQQQTEYNEPSVTTDSANSYTPAPQPEPQYTPSASSSSDEEELPF